MIEDEWAAGYVRRKRHDTMPFIRYTGDHDRLIAWLDEHSVHWTGMHTIDGTKHGEGLKERWFVNGQQVDLATGQYVIIDGLRLRVYDPDQMERFYDLAVGPE